ncbi:MAG: response regulator [Euryarchaeota archaeon]|nr:response regulator [Euryarchaeota archaeon]
MARILVVDDNEEIAHLVSIILGREGYDVEIALSGDECIEKLNSFRPDLILMDYFMPGDDGVVVSKHIKEDLRFRSTPIILFTIMSLQEGLQEAVEEAGAVDYIQKPFDIESMLHKIRRALSAAPVPAK